MSKVLFIMDMEEGHILPSFGLAQSLRDRGHEIFYLSIPDNEELVRQEGFGFYPIFQKAYPKGYRHLHKQRQGAGGEAPSDKYNYLDEILDGSYDGFLKGLRADLYIVSDFLRIDALVMYHYYKIRPVIFTPFLREPGVTLASDCIGDLMKMAGEDSARLIRCFMEAGLQLTSLEQLTAPMDNLLSLIACPGELQEKNFLAKGNRVYIGPSIRKGKGLQHELYYKNISPHKKIIYASMGSQAVRHKAACLRFFTIIIQMMEEHALRDTHLVLSIGPDLEENLLPLPPANVTLVKWVSQVDLLQVASLAVIHGGMGAVKECIYFGVPMIVLPLMRDQPYNARLVKHHGLGVSDNIHTITKEQLLSHVLDIFSSGEIKAHLESMQAIFRDKEQSQEGAAIIDELLTAEV